MNTIILKGEPVSTGSIYKIAVRGKFPSIYMISRGKTIKESYVAQARAQWPSQPLACDLVVIIRLFFGNKRKNDIDNFNKLLLDSLTGIAWYDDSQIQIMNISKSYDKENPRIEISISAII